MKFVKLSIFALSLGLFVASCGESKTEETPATDSTATEMAAPAPEATTEPAATTDTTAAAGAATTTDTTKAAH